MVLFVFDKGYFRHSITSLGIIKSSPYYKELDANKQLDDYISCFDKLLPKNYILQESKHDICILLDYVKSGYNRFWNYFQTIENSYISNNFEYNIVKLDENIGSITNGVGNSNNHL